MRVLVTGANGQLGSELVDVLRQRGHHATGAGRAELDITEPGAAAAAIEIHAPDALVNCAAWTQVDAAETEVEAAILANAVGPRLLAAACQARSVLLCHMSTDFVFDGNAREPIDELTTPRPISAYGATKLAGEEEVRRLCPRHQVVRTSWLYGRDGPNFVLTILRLARELGRLRVVADQVGSPTWTGHLAAAVARLVEHGVPGTYHLTNSGVATWHEFALAILEDAGMGQVPVEAIATSDYPTAARRPAYSVLANRAWRMLGEDPLPQWREGLAAYLKERQLPSDSRVGEQAHNPDH